MKYLTIIITILLWGCNSKEKAKSSHDSVNSTVATTIEKKELPIELKTTKQFEFKNPDLPISLGDTLVLNYSEKNYIIFPNGLLTINNNDSIQLKLEAQVEKAFIHDDEKYYYIFFTDASMIEGTSRLEKVSKTTMTSIYTQSIYGFNLGMPYVSKDFAYVNAIGFIGKIDLKDGKYVWNHMDLYDSEKSSFNSFDSICSNQSSIEFISKNSKTKTIDRIVVDNKTGDITIIDK